MSRRDRPAPPVRRAHRPWARVVQSSAFVRKELVEILRQPRLIGLLVVGPFALLLLFGAGYRNEDLRMRTMFVGPAGSFYEDAVTRYEDVLSRYVRPAGFTDDEAAAREDLSRGDVDAVVVFPKDPLDTILGGHRAVVTVLHDKLDPIQQTAVEVASRLAVQEVNASVVTAVVGGGQAAVRPFDDVMATATSEAAAVTSAAASGDPADAARAASRVATAAGQAHDVLAASDTMLQRLGAGDDATRRDVMAGLARLRDDADAVAADQGGDLSARAATLSADLDAVAAAVPKVATIDPAVLVRPFVADARSIAPVQIDPADYFTPAALALLLQHLAVTFAALSLVRDRELGLFELLRVGPLSSWEIIAGKTIAYLAVGMLVGIALLEAAVHLLGVPLVGALLWVLFAFALVLLAALAMGTLISLISHSETQAVQWAMLTLLAGLFFSGFVLSLDGLAYPVKAISWLLPATYGIRVLQDVMLRGDVPADADLIGLGALVVGYGGLATVMLWRQLRTAS
jgi:ABC-2 type transport system permease protein